MLNLSYYFFWQKKWNYTTPWKVFYLAKNENKLRKSFRKWNNCITWVPIYPEGIRIKNLLFLEDRLRLQNYNLITVKNVIEKKSQAQKVIWNIYKSWADQGALPPPGWPRPQAPPPKKKAQSFFNNCAVWAIILLMMNNCILLLNMHSQHPSCIKKTKNKFA